VKSLKIFHLLFSVSSRQADSVRQNAIYRNIRGHVLRISTDEQRSFVVLNLAPYFGAVTSNKVLHVDLLLRNTTVSFLD
jgi:hypothetical protein